MLLCLVLVVIAALAYQKLALIQEAFQNISYDDTELSTCPANLTAERKKGIVVCNDKEGLPVCTLGANTNANNKIPHCSEILHEYYGAHAAAFCPPSMPNYFEDSANGTSGCTSGQLKPNKKAPAMDSAIQCGIYESDLDTTTQTSCFNQMQLETTELFGENATKHLLPIGGEPSAYVTVMQYKRPGSSLPNRCVPDAHATHLIDYMQRHIDTTLSADQQQSEIDTLTSIDQFVKTGKFVGSCEAQKKVFVDRSLQESDLSPSSSPFPFMSGP